MRVSVIFTVIIIIIIFTVIIIIIDLMGGWEKALLHLKNVAIFFQEDEMQPEIVFFLRCC